MVKLAKKVFAAFSILLLMAVATSEDLRVPHRLFEIGIAPEFGASNNVVPLPDIFKKNLVLDLKKIAANTSARGLTINENIDTRAFFMNLNLRNGLQFGMTVGVESNGNFNIGKSLFDAIGNGFNGSVEVDGGADADVFAYATLSGSFKLQNQMRFSIMPSLVAPLVYARGRNISGSFYSNEKGFGVSIDGEASVFSSIFDVSQIFDGKFAMDSFDFAKLAQSFGFDLGLAFEMPFPLYDKLQLGAYARIPIVPGTLKYGATGVVDWDLEGELTQFFSGNFGEIPTFEFKTEGGVINHKISRPLRFGAEVAFRPFGSWFDVYALLGMGMRYPYSNDIKVYPEYMASVSVNAGNIVGVAFSTNYLGQVFKQELTFMLNAKVFELNFAISMQSENFVKSFQAAGLGAKLYAALGVPVFEKRELPLKNQEFVKHEDNLEYLVVAPNEDDSEHLIIVPNIK